MQIDYYKSEFSSPESKFEKELDSIFAKFQQCTFAITPFDVKCALRKIKKKTSAGIDLVSAKQFQNDSDLLVQHLSLLFQMSISSGVLPQQFCIIQITPIPKKEKKNLQDSQSYHPITVLCTSFRIFESSILSKTSCKCCSPPDQFGSMSQILVGFTFPNFKAV